MWKYFNLWLSTLGLEHGGEECYNYKCNQKNGKCDWCGTRGYCCRKGHKGGGCDGSFGGSSSHQCVLKPIGDKNNYRLWKWPLKIVELQSIGSNICVLWD